MGGARRLAHRNMKGDNIGNGINIECRSPFDALPKKKEREGQKKNLGMISLAVI